MILEELKIPLVFDVSGLLGSALGAVSDAVGSVVNFATSSITEAMDAQDIQAQLNAVLQSTGGVAGVTADQVNDLASSLSRMTRFEDDAIVSGENMLLTFTSIGKEIFPRATETILDMSQALGQDLKTSAIQLGKALNDPISGISALRRVGVQFTDAQEEMIREMVESGDLMGAQSLILSELQREFGGSAVAAGQTFGGQLEILKNRLGDIKENIGNALLPMLTQLAGRFSTLIDSPAFQGMIDGIIQKLSEFGNWVITNLPTWEEKFTTWLGNIAKWWNETAKPALDDMRTWLDERIKPVIEAFQLSWENMSGSWTRNVSPVLSELIRLFGNIHSIMEKLDPSTDRVAGKFTLLGIAQRIAVAWATLVNYHLDLLRANLDVLNGMLERGIQRWNSMTSAVYRLIGALAQLALPWWLTPGSPTPMENGLRGVSSALNDLNRQALPSFATNLGGLQAAPATSGSSIDYQKFARVLAVELGKQFG